MIEIYKLFIELEKLKFEIFFQWVPSHCQILLNEFADDLAKNGCNLPQSENPINFEQSKKLINAAISSKLDNFYSTNTEGKNYQQLLKNDLLSLNKKEMTANFRRITQHDILNAHLHRFGLVTDPKCFLCKEEDETSNHLWKCRMLKEIRDTLKKLNLNDYEFFSKLYFHFRDLKNAAM